ncbi:MAG TPA: hypothetical protein VF471_01570 [Pseudoxanthomonas sp.]
MKSYSPEPLTPEERELAKLTAHLGPQGEPSPSLDARILSAAHAALERKQPARRKPRWPVAMGLAASVVFAVGIAWQLRPLQQAPMPASAEAPADESAEQPAVAATILSSPALPQADVAADMASAAPAAPVSVEQAPPAPLKVLAPPPAEARAPLPRQQVARAKTRVSARQAQIAGNVAAAATPPPPAPPAPAAIAATAEAEADAPMAFAPEPRGRENQHDGYLARGVAADSSMAGAGIVSAKPQAEALAEAKAARAAASTRQKESASLDRIEVTGSRMKRTDLQVPVSDDAQLPVNEWLERVRTRYGLGDAGAAKQSLLLFVKDHPSEPVPGDLEPLLEE